MRSDAATSRPMKLAPRTTARVAFSAAATMAATVGQCSGGSERALRRGGAFPDPTLSARRPWPGATRRRRRVRPSSSAHLALFRPKLGGRGGRLKGGDRLVAIVFRGPERQPFLWCRPRQKILRDIGAIVGSGLVGIHDRNRAFVSLGAQRGGRAVPGRAAADDEHRFGRRTAAGPCPRWCGGLARHPDLAVALLDDVAIEGSERGRTQRLPRAEAEAGVVPWTANRVADDQSLREWSAIVAARGADREPLPSCASEQDRLAINVSGYAPSPSRTWSGAMPSRRSGPVGFCILGGHGVAMAIDC